MTYSDPERLIHYENNVNIRQGTDVLDGGVADIYLTQDSNEVDHTVVQRKVVMTQPNRKATGDWMQYTSAEDMAILKGSPARVEDTQQGTTEGERLTVYMRDNRVIADDARGPQSPGRVRSTHQVKKQAINP